MKPKLFTVLIYHLILSSSLVASGFDDDDTFLGPVVRRDERKSLVVTDYGEISAVDIRDGTRSEPYHIQFITLEPNALFLPVLLQADMVYYVHTGRGRLHWADDDEMRKVNLRRGDVYRLHSGSLFYMQSNLEPEREKLRIFAFFANPKDEFYEREIGPYSSIVNLVRGFDRKVLREAFKVSEEVIEEMVSGVGPPQIVHAVPTKKKTFWEMEARFLKSFSEVRNSIENNKKKQSKVYNIFDGKPDFENCNGWSLTVNKNNLHLLRGSDIGLFMVNLTKGSMMGPHWNPMANEVAIVLKGRGMVRVAGSNVKNSTESSGTSFRVEEGDVFAVPRFHPMAQMSFNNGSMVFMGFSTTRRRNHPQFLAGKSSVLRALDKEIMAISFNVNGSVIEQVLGKQEESVILECVSCAEEEERIMEEEIEREKEEGRKREEEEARKREEEEEARREEEEEEERKRREEEEEEARREEEEEKKREEKERKRREEEEERKREEEEEQERREEEEEGRREEEERKRREEEEEKKREEEEEQERREEEERKRREEEEEKRREEEERKRREEEEEKRREEEEEQERREEEEEGRREEEERKRREEEEEKKREEEEEQERREEEERKRREEEEEKRREERREEEERKRREEEERREEGERKRREEEEEKRREEEEEREGRKGEKGREWEEEEEARKQEEERQKRGREERREREREEGEREEEEEEEEEDRGL